MENFRLKAFIYTFFKALIFLPIIVFVSCNEEKITEDTDVEKLVNFVSEDSNQLSELDKLTISYFKEIALGSEFGNASKITRKWQSDINLFVEGNPNPELVIELNDIVSDLNALIQEDNIKINITTNSSNANTTIFFGSRFDFKDRFPEASNINLENNVGFALTFVDVVNMNIIRRALIFIDNTRENNTSQKSVIREEITQALGLGNDSDKYEDSIFFETTENNRNAVTSFSRLDRIIIKLLYNPNIEVGMDAKSVEEKLKEILINKKQ